MVGSATRVEIKAGEDAIRWAKQRYRGKCIMNFDALRYEAEKHVEAGKELPNNLFNDRMRRAGMKPEFWPALSRLLVMDNPALIAHVQPHYSEAFDSQPGVAMLCIYYRQITGTPPRVRSWRIARQEQGVRY